MPFGQKYIFLFIDCFIDLDLLLFFFVDIDMNGNASELGLELFSTIGLFTIFMFLFLVPEFHNIELTFGPDRLGFRFACVSAQPISCKLLLQLSYVLFLVILYLLNFDLH